MLTALALQDISGMVRNALSVRFAAHTQVQLSYARSGAQQTQRSAIAMPDITGTALCAPSADIAAKMRRYRLQVHVLSGARPIQCSANAMRDTMETEPPARRA